MVELCDDFENELSSALRNAKEIWIAVAMMNNGGFSLFKDLEDVKQHHIIGIDLPTPPKILVQLKEKCSESFSALVHDTVYTYHPKVYIIKGSDNQLQAFIGSSNATTAGLTKNIELNVKISDQTECYKLITWFNQLKKESRLITKELIEDYSKRYKAIKKREKQTEKEVDKLKKESKERSGQFFTKDHHEVFARQYVEIENDDLKRIRKIVRDRLIDLHYRICPRFEEFDLIDLHEHHSKKDRVSKHYFNPFSGYYIESLWLHYGKSEPQLQQFNERSFLDHTRLQVIIHQKDVGIWLMLGIEKKGRIDRDHFRIQMEDENIRNTFYNELKKLDDSYWIDYKGWKERVYVKDIKSSGELHEITKEENINHYFIIGRFYDPDDKVLADLNIDNTVLEEFKKLYPLYVIMSNRL